MRTGNEKFWTKGHHKQKSFLLNGPQCGKTCLQGYANNTVADLRSLISDFVIRYLESNVCTLATGEILIFLIAEETGLNLTLLETQKTGFLATRPKF